MLYITYLKKIFLVKCPSKIAADRGDAEDCSSVPWKIMQDREIAKDSFLCKRRKKELGFGPAIDRHLSIGS